MGVINRGYFQFQSVTDHKAMIFRNRKHSTVDNRFKIFSFDPILHGVFIYGLPQNPTFKAVVLKFWEIFIKLNQIKIKYEVYIPAEFD